MLWAPAKEELFAKPFPRLIYSSWGAFPVRRKRDVKAGRILNDLLLDQKVMLFPEGTRHKDGKLGAGNRGSEKSSTTPVRPSFRSRFDRTEQLEVSPDSDKRRQLFSEHHSILAIFFNGKTAKRPIC